MTTGWARDTEHEAALEELRSMGREQLVARLNFLAPELTLDGLREAVVAAMVAPKRVLDRAALVAEQRLAEQRLAERS